MSLRAEELLKSERPFHARGSKVKRCDECLLPKQNCICCHKPAQSTNVATVFLMYKGEYYKPTNTGRLIADVVKENYAFLWHRTEPQAQLLELLNNSSYLPIVVFPHEYAHADNRINQPPQIDDKKLLFIFLDGTWREAKKMFSKSAYLANLPVLGVNVNETSDYLLREASHTFQHCTAEVGISVLELAGEKDGAETLAQYFSIFRREYVKGKPHLRDKLAFATSQVK